MRTQCNLDTEDTNPTNQTQTNLTREIVWVCGVSSICKNFKNLFLLQGVPKKIGILSNFDFLGLGGVFLRVQNNSKIFGNKKN